MRYRHWKNLVVHAVVDAPASAVASTVDVFSEQSREARNLQISRVRNEKRIEKELADKEKAEKKAKREAEKAEGRKQLAETRAEIKLLAAQRLEAKAREDLTVIEAERILAQKNAPAKADAPAAPVTDVDVTAMEKMQGEIESLKHQLSLVNSPLVGNGIKGADSPAPPAKGPAKRMPKSMQPKEEAAVAPAAE